MDFQEKKIEGNGHVAIHNWTPVDESGKHKNSREIENEIDTTRHTMDEIMDALEGKFNPHSMIDRVIDYFGSPKNREKATHGLSDFANTISDSFKRNPLPVMMITTGAAWALWESQRKEREPGAAQYDKEKGEDKFKGAKEKISGKGEKLREQGMEIEKKASEISSKAGEKLGQSTSKANSFINDNPLLAGGIALLAGMIVGAAFPRTEKEQESQEESKGEMMKEDIQSDSVTEDKSEPKVILAEEEFKKELPLVNTDEKETPPKGDIRGEDSSGLLP